MVWPRIWFPNELRVLSASLLLPRLRMLRLQRFVEYLALFAVVPHRMTCLYKNKTSHLCPASLVKGRWRRSAGGIPACCRLLSFNHPVGAGHARPAHFRKPLRQSQTTTSYTNHPGHISLRPRGNLPGALLFTHHISQVIESVAATDSVFVFMGVTERLRQSLVLPMKR